MLVQPKQIAGGGSGGVNNSFVIFRPGLPSSGAFVSTWAEVRTAAQTGLASLYVDDSNAPCQTDAAPTDFKFVDDIQAFRRQGAVLPVLKIVNGGQLRNVRQIFSVEMQCESLALPSFGADNYSQSPILAVGQGATLKMTNNATQSAILLGAGEGIVLAVAAGGAIDADLPVGGTCVVNLSDATSTMLMPVILGSDIKVDTVKGVLGSTWQMPYDGNYGNAPFLQPNFLGTFQPFRVTKANLIEPSAGLSRPVSGPTPSPNDPRPGQMYFDQSIIPPRAIWCKSAGFGLDTWVDGAGVVVPLVVV
jgi:hypothetical protein